MRGYDRDEYEDLDEYEEEGEEYEEEGGGEEYQEEETHQPTQEELEYLELRQRLKETFRKQMKKELGTADPSSRDKNNALRKDNYGSFFGPSQPVIAPRVIQESKSLLENPNFAARVSKSNHSIQANKSSASATSGSKPRVDHPSRVTNGVKTKVEMLKNTRDYSFLLSDDAEVPAPMKNPPPRNASAPNSEARSAQLPQRSKQPAKDSGKKAFTGHLERKPMPAGGQLRPKVGSEKLAPASKLSMGSKQKLGMNNGSGPGRPVGMKVTPSRNPAATTGKKVTAPVAKSSMPGERKPIPSRLQPQVHKPNPSQLQSSVPKKPLIQRKESRETSKAKVIPKQPMSSSRPQVKPLPPKSSARGTLADEHPKRKPVSRYDENSDDDVQAISMIRKMFGYNPNKYRDDDDDSDMEANFDDILAEEKRSAIIARKEDEEQLRLIEEEERRERMRLAKRQKR